MELGSFGGFWRVFCEDFWGFCENFGEDFGRHNLLMTIDNLLMLKNF